MTDLLIVTCETDIHADVVINELQKSNIRAIRLNSESFIKKSKYAYSWQASGNPSQSFLSFEDSLKEAQDIGVIWWRKPQDYQVFPEVDDAWAIKYCQEETESLMYSLSGLYPKARWVNNYYKIRLPSHRINQIPIAQKVGITIPPTLVTNSYDAACNFVTQQGKCIVKPMRYSGFLHDDKQYACYTRPIDVETLLEFQESIRLAPVFIQKRIQKKAEYRVTLIGKHDFVCRIDAKHTKDADVTLDWRVTEPDKLVHVPDKLPMDYLNKLHQMLDEFGLNFGAFDIIRDDDDTLYFIELNPNGQWYWIEILTKMPMVRAMVELIEDLALQYQQDC
ncbi:MvdC/MvdD family ATP grasp protein [Microcoleus sp. CAWBG640]|uniref:MvdC/MvdD family ATP grasp protein n=1 Tax=Microcoleus sp. CAWBG640 TaxID=2841653 RepID=UPI00312B51F8